MRRRLFISLLLILSLFSFASFAQEDSAIGFKQKWYTSAKDFKKYTQVYIFGIDLRNMGIQKLDQDGDRTVSSVDEDSLQFIGYKIAQALSEKINPVIPVASQEEEIKNAKDLKGKNSVILNISVSYEMVMQERGYLMRSLGAKEEAQVSPGKISMECIFTETDTGKKLLKINDSEDFSIENKSKPFSTQTDLDGFDQIIQTWAQRIAHQLSQEG